MKLSISVMAHPSRSKFFPYLKEKLGENIPISIDDGQGLWANCRKAWLSYEKDSDYHVVIQDDAIICENFRELAEKILVVGNQRAGQCAFNFYFGNRSRFKKAADEGMKNGYLLRKLPRWGVAICLPTKRIREMIKFCDQLKHIPQDDHRIGRYLAKHKIKVYFPMPSLVDHRTGEKSLVGDPGMGRKAFYFIDDIRMAK